MSKVILRKQNSEYNKIEIGSEVKEIILDLKSPRLITVHGIGEKGKTVERHLIITDKCRLTLV